MLLAHPEALRHLLGGHSLYPGVLGRCLLLALHSNYGLAVFVVVVVLVGLIRGTLILLIELRFAALKNILNATISELRVLQRECLTC